MINAAFLNLIRSQDPQEVKDLYEMMKAYRGECVLCHQPVYYHYPWWNKNPELYKDARPYHDECFQKTLVDDF